MRAAPPPPSRVSPASPLAHAHGQLFLLAQGSFDDFNTRMNEYFSRGCGCAMKMAQCPDAVG
jgi:hypothetical protein